MDRKRRLEQNGLNLKLRKCLGVWLLCSHLPGFWALSCLSLLSTRVETEGEGPVCRGQLAFSLNNLHMRTEFTPVTQDESHLDFCLSPTDRVHQVQGGILLPEAHCYLTHIWQNEIVKVIVQCGNVSLFWHTYIFTFFWQSHATDKISPTPPSSASRRCNLKGHISNPVEIHSLWPQNSNFESRVQILRRCGWVGDNEGRSLTPH